MKIENERLNIINIDYKNQIDYYSNQMNIFKNKLFELRNTINLASHDNDELIKYYKNKSLETSDATQTNEKYVNTIGQLENELNDIKQVCLIVCILFKCLLIMMLMCVYSNKR